MQKNATTQIDPICKDISSVTTTMIPLRPLAGFSTFEEPKQTATEVDQWRGVFSEAAFFHGFDIQLFGPVVLMVYKNHKTAKLLCVSMTKFGTNVYENLLIDASSRFWPAVLNLSANHKDSNVRKALAIANLKNYNRLHSNQESLKSSWDETNAGALASQMEVLEVPTPAELGQMVAQLGLLQDHFLSCALVDVVYHSAFSVENNRFVHGLGTQLDSLFDPLKEYSPQLDYLYVPPAQSGGCPVELFNVLEELVSVQEKFAADLVNLVQKVVVPLRVKALETSHSNCVIVKVNLVFPTTLDEVSRVNCTLAENLHKCKPYGVAEVFRVFADILPYLYRAFVLHESYIVGFKDRLEREMRECSFFDLKDYSVLSAEAIVCGCLLELPRIKLIMQRLWTEMDTLLQEEIHPYYAKCMDIIDAFGYKETQPRPTSRIFTPTGKLLTELATGWPEELQYGWMNRKVIGVFEMHEVLSAKDVSQVLIIFSDYVLLLDAFHDAESSVFVADALMNSLINERPLPENALFPQLHVRCWAPINETFCSGYNTELDSYLSFVAPFQTKSGKSDSIQCFLSAHQKSILTMVEKAKVLHKSTLFHLFSDDLPGLQIFYSAHEWKDFSDERSVAPVVMLLNGTDEEIKLVFENHKSVFLVLSASFINHHTMAVAGHTRDASVIEEIVRISDIKPSLRDLLARIMDSFFRSTFLSNLTVAGHQDLLEKLLQAASPETPDFSVYPEPKMEHSEIKPEIRQEQPAKIAKPQPVKPKRRSFFGGIFHKLGKHKTEHRRSQNNDTKIPNTPIPRGKKQKYSKLYQPEPHLREASVTSSMKEPAKPQQNRQVSTNTNSSSKYSDPSIDVRRDFTFPLETVQELEDAETMVRFSTELQPDALPEPDKFTMRAVPKKEQEPQEPAMSEQEPKEPEQKPKLIFRDDPKIVPLKAPVETPVQAPAQARKPMIDLPKMEPPKMEAKLPNEQRAVPETVDGKATPDSASLASSNQPVTPNVLPKIQRVQNEVQLFKPERKVTDQLVKKAILSHDIARALEHINAAGISPETYKKYKPYEELPVLILQDGQPNWTPISRENLSNLRDHVQTIPEEANMDSFHMMESPMQMTVPETQFDSSCNTISTSDHVITQELSADTGMFPKAVAQPAINQEELLQLLNLMYMDKFGRLLDAEFELDEEPQSVPHKSSPFTVDTMLLEDSVVSEEYFSSEDRQPAELYIVENPAKATLIRLSSSERTLMSISREIEKEKESFDGFSIRFDSVAYLSDILNGTVKI